MQEQDDLSCIGVALRQGKDCYHCQRSVRRELVESLRYRFECLMCMKLMPWLDRHGVTCWPSSSISSTSGKKRSTYDNGTSSRYERWIRGLPFKSRIAMRLAMVDEEIDGCGGGSLRFSQVGAAASGLVCFPRTTPKHTYF